MTGFKHFLLDALFFGLHLFGLFLALKELLHAGCSLSNIEMVDTSFLSSLVCIWFESRIFLLESIIFHLILSLLQFGFLLNVPYLGSFHHGHGALVERLLHLGLLFILV